MLGTILKTIEMKQILAIICILFFSRSALAQEQSVTDIIKSVKTTYGNLNTYFDSGKVVSSFYDLPHLFSSAKLFKTSYSSNGLLNFEYYELGVSNSLYVINKSNNKVQSWWGITNEIKTYPSLNVPLAAATGVSSTSSILIPKLLLTKEVSAKSIFETIVEPKYIRKELINGTSCFVIGAKGKLDEDIQIWIGDKDFLLRKVMTDKKVKNFRVKATLQFFPYQPLKSNNSLFVFKPNRQIEL